MRPERAENGIMFILHETRGVISSEISITARLESQQPIGN